MIRVADLDPQRIISERVFDGKKEEEVDIRYQSVKVVGNGSFGVVFQVKLVDTGKEAAIKRVLQDKRFKVFFHLREFLTDGNRTESCKL